MRRERLGMKACQCISCASGGCTQDVIPSPFIYFLYLFIYLSWAEAVLGYFFPPQEIPRAGGLYFNPLTFQHQNALRR